MKILIWSKNYILVWARKFCPREIFRVEDSFAKLHQELPSIIGSLRLDFNSGGRPRNFRRYNVPYISPRVLGKSLSGRLKWRDTRRGSQNFWRISRRVTWRVGRSIFWNVTLCRVGVGVSKIFNFQCHVIFESSLRAGKSRETFKVI